MTDAFVTSDLGSTPKRKYRAGSLRRPFIQWILIAGAVTAFIYVYIGGNYGLYRLWKLKQQKSSLEYTITNLEAERLNLTQELELLQQDPNTDSRLRFKLEKIAREEYGMVREGEVVYRFVPEEKHDKKKE